MLENLFDLIEIHKFCKLSTLDFYYFSQEADETQKLGKR